MEAGVKRYSFTRLYYKMGNTIKEMMHPDWPWWPAEAVSVCSKLIRKTDRVLEFGSGRSTFWLAKRSASVISLENHQAWYEKVKAKVDNAEVRDRVKLIYAPVVAGVAISDQPYLQSVKELQADSVDFVVIDGKFRAHTTLLSIPLLKSGGVLLIDDAHRCLPDFSKGSTLLPETKDSELWKEIYETVKGWRSLWTTDGFRCTVFLIKP